MTNQWIFRTYFLYKAEPWHNSNQQNERNIWLIFFKCAIILLVKTTIPYKSCEKDNNTWKALVDNGGPCTQQLTRGLLLLLSTAKARTLCPKARGILCPKAWRVLCPKATPSLGGQSSKASCTPLTHAPKRRGVWRLRQTAKCQRVVGCKAERKKNGLLHFTCKLGQLNQVDFPPVHSEQQFRHRHGEEQKKMNQQRINKHSKDITQMQQQRPESPVVALNWQAGKYKVHTLHLRYIL